jgi:multimeric flavodoxin WrbA
MTTILIVYHSQTGHTRKMAEAVAEGVMAVEGVRASLKRADQATVEDLLACDGLAVGTPEYFGYMAGLVKDFFDRTYEPARSRREVFRKPYVVFVCAGNDGRGALAAVERIALGYPFKKVYDPVVSRGGLTGDILDQCRLLGQTIAAGCEAGIY